MEALSLRSQKQRLKKGMHKGYLSRGIGGVPPRKPFGRVGGIGEARSFMEGGESRYKVRNEVIIRLVTRG